MAKKVNQKRASEAASTLASESSTEKQKKAAAKKLNEHKGYHPHD